MTNDRFTYGSGTSITSLSRTSGPVAGGTSVIITGTGFSTVEQRQVRDDDSQGLHGQIDDPDCGHRTGTDTRPGKSGSGDDGRRTTPATSNDLYTY